MEKGPKVPVTYLGLETSGVPRVVSEQLGLQKGFGLVVDYVVPDGPAAAAGLQQNDILKMLNDQILMEPDQLAKLVRSFPEGTTVTLTVLRKGAETKLTAKLGKREVSERIFKRGFDKWGQGMNFDFNFEKFGEDMGKLGEDMGKLHAQEAAEHAREQSRHAREMAREESQRVRELAREETRRARDETKRAAEEVRRAARELRVSRGEDGSLKSTTIDMRRAEIVFHDDKGELKLENVAGKKVLTAKDPQGRLVFSGPVETKEELDKLPAEVRQRYDKLEQKDLPAINPPMSEEEHEQAADAADEEEEERDGDAIQQVLGRALGFPYRRFGISTVLI